MATINTTSYIRNAQPLNRTLSPQVSRQTFLTTPSTGFTLPIPARARRVVAGRARVVRIAAQKAVRATVKAVRQKVQVPTKNQLQIQTRFDLGKIYKDLAFVELFSSNEKITQDPNIGKQLKNWLDGNHKVNLNPKTSNKHGCKTILELLRSGDMELELPSLLEIWLAKMLNTDNGHHLKFVTGVGCIDFINYLSGAIRKILNIDTPVLTEKMEKIKHLYALLYLGLVLNMLIKDKAISIEKKPYGIQTYLRYLANMTNKPEHKNDIMFSIVYHRTHQFVYKKLGRVNKIQLRCVFHIFRFETVDGPRTKINISSCYPRGLLDQIKCKFWASDRIDVLSQDQREFVQPDEDKFEYIKQEFKRYSIFDALHEIYPDLETNDELKTRIKQALKVESLKFDEVMKSYSEIMS